MPPELSGTSENAAGSTPGSSSAPSSGMSGVTLSHGTASEALIKAATASSSEATPPVGATGDTPATGGTGQPPAISDATGQPKPAGSPAAPAGTGEAPEARIQAATRNARTKAIDEVGRALGVPLTQQSVKDIREGLSLIRRLSTPDGARAFLSELATAVAKSGGRAGEVTGEAEGLPEADLVSPDGRFKTYSADALSKALEIHGRNTRTALLRELSPLIESVRGIQTERTTAASQAQAKALTTEVMSHARQMPGFKENEPAIQAEMKRLGPAVLEVAGPIGLLHMAYNNIRMRVIDPAHKTTLEQEIRKSLNTRAAAGAAAAAVGSPGGEKVKPELNGPEQLAAHMERMAAAAS